MEKETSEERNLEKQQLRKEADQVYELMRLCNDQKKPDAQARKELKELINTSEIAQAILERQSGLFMNTLKERIEKYSCTDTFREVTLFKCQELREKLGHSTASQLEKLAINQIVLCWLNMHLVELTLINRLANDHDRDSGIYWEKRLNFANQRYSRALDTLVKMRKMNLTLQINHAQNQIVKNG